MAKELIPYKSITEKDVLNALGYEYPEKIVLLSVQDLSCGGEKHPVYGRGFLTGKGLEEYVIAKKDKFAEGNFYFDDTELIFHASEEFLHASVKDKLGILDNSIKTHIRENHRIFFYEIWSDDFKETPILLEDVIREHPEYFDPKRKESVFVTHGTKKITETYEDKIVVQFQNWGTNNAIKRQMRHLFYKHFRT